MDKKQKNVYFLHLILVAVFIASAFLYRIYRFNWELTPMIVTDVILSLAFALTAFLTARNAGKVKRLIFSFAALILANLILWGISMPLMTLQFSGTKSITLSLLILFIVYAIMVIKSIRKDDENGNAERNSITSCLLLLAFVASFAIFVNSLNLADTVEDYDKRIKSVDFFESNFENAVPQTDVYTIIKEHFNSELPEGKTEKKCIVIGMDGTRADMLSFIGEHEESGFNDVLSQGGHAYLAYCGAVNWPAVNLQDTSTAPGWLSMLTGIWAKDLGVVENYVPKSNDNLTSLTKLVEDATIDSSAFYVSWDGHFVNRSGTYSNEKKYIEDKNLDVSFVDAASDSGTYDNVMNDIKSEDCSDYIFSIFEYCDHVGHSSDFNPENPAYAEAYRMDDLTAHRIIEAIKNRPSYDKEDWLIIMTTDHGGYMANHGGPSKQERYTFIVTNKEISK
mgnify:CR=1 FL=1